jgi:hypothetical protein
MRKSLWVREERLQKIVFMNSRLATDLARKCLAHLLRRGRAARLTEKRRTYACESQSSARALLNRSLAAWVEKGR